MKKYDYYYSATAEQRLRGNGMRRCCGYTECRFKGKIFVEAIAHGKKPLMPDEDLKLIGTGTDNDCTYA